MKANRTKVAVIGTRGIPDIQGGVETHCRELYPRLAKKGMDITIMGRKPYSLSGEPKIYEGVKINWIPTLKIKSIEAPLHSFISIFIAKKNGADIVHLHACCSGLFAPLAKALGMKVVFTHHGEDYNRVKWGKLAKTVLKWGEKLGVKYSDRIICVSQSINDMIETEYHKTTITIPNGISKKHNTNTITERIKNLYRDKKYILSVGRIDPGKGFDILINAYSSSNIREEWLLIIAGGSEHPSSFSKALVKSALLNGVTMTGHISHEEVNMLLKNASLFVLPSLHEGHPIALLEAMGHNLDVLVSDIPSCKLPELEDGDFFESGNAEALKTALNNKLSHTTVRNYDMSRYDWNHIAELTYSVYQQL